MWGPPHQQHVAVKAKVWKLALKYPNRLTTWGPDPNRPTRWDPDCNRRSGIFFWKLALTHTPDPNRSTAISSVHVNGRSLYTVNQRMMVVEGGGGVVQKGECPGEYVQREMPGSRLGASSSWVNVTTSTASLMQLYWLPVRPVQTLLY